MSRGAQRGSGSGLEGNFTTEAQRPQRAASEGKPTVTVPPLLALPCLLTEERFFPTHSEKDRFEWLLGRVSFAVTTTTGEAQS